MATQSSDEFIYFVSGMWCSTCAKNVRESVQSVDGVSAAQLNYASKLLFVKSNTDVVDCLELDQSIQNKVTRMGFGIKRQSGDWVLRFHEVLQKEGNQKISWAEISIVWFLAMWSSMLAFSSYLGDLDSHALHLLTLASAAFGLPAIIIGIRPYANAGLRALWFSRLLTLDLFIFFGAIAVLVVSLNSLILGTDQSYADSGSMIIAILLLTKKIEALVTSKITNGILFQLHPKVNGTRLFKKGKWTLADVSQIKRGDLIQIAPGETVPLDGVLESDEGTSNNHLMSGEASRVLLRKGDDLFAGVISCSLMTLRVTAPLGERIIDAWAEKALISSDKSGRYEKLFQKIESRMVIVATSGALFIALTSFFRGGGPWEVTESFFVGILVFCPCLFASILPLAKQIAYLALLNSGILTSRLEALLDLNGVRRFYFDKTGTLEAVESTFISFTGDSRISAYISKLATIGQHAILRGLTNSITPLDTRVQIENFQEHANKGVTALVGEAERLVVGRESFLREQGVQIPKPLDSTTSYVALNEKVVGKILSKKVYDSKSLTFLKFIINNVENSEIEILSGDPSPTAGHTYTEIDSHIKYFGSLSPDEKSNRVKPHSAFIGDGLNDTLALAKAQVSFRIGQRVSGFAPVDFYLRDPDLGAITVVLRYAKKYRRISLQTAAFAVVYNITALTLAILGLFSPLSAVVAMLTSFSLMLLSILRLKKVDGSVC